MHSFGLEFIHKQHTLHAYINIYYKTIHLKTWVDYTLSPGESMKILSTGKFQFSKTTTAQNHFLSSGKFVVSFESTVMEGLMIQIISSLPL